MKYFSVLVLSILALCACKSPAPKQQEALPSNSVFNLTSQWQNQDGDTLQLQDLNGKTLVVVMIYTSCKSACPILVAKMKKIESKISRKDIDKVSLVLVSIDPETDTPEHLKEFAKTNGMDEKQWVFLRSNEEATHELANVLAMKYKKISPIDFSHSNIISVFNPSGVLVSQEEGLEINVDGVANTVAKTVKGS
ncbi:MAG: SCO family protein [Ferruginibacter sp.]|nr:SCO family protein [Ferruginibacter sp.]